MSSLSVILITKNEASNIRACLESVAWADEVIVVDSGSADDTINIACSMGARVFEHDWPGFGAQKNRALSYATKEWVLSIDADERVTSALRSEIERAIINSDYDGYYLPRLSQFLGKFIHHCGWYPDYVLRLFKRNKASFSRDMVHERVLLNGASAKLKAPMLHFSYINEADVERKTAQYSDAAATQMCKAGKRAGIVRAALSSIWAFIRTYIVRLGVLDGRAGWGIAKMNARTTWLKYRKLAALNAAKD